MHGSSDNLLVNIIVVTIGGILLYIVAFVIAIPRIRKAKKAAAILAEADRLFQSGNYKTALELTEEATRLDESAAPLVHFRRATMHDKLGDSQSARTSYELFLRKSPIATQSPEIDIAKKRIVELGGSL